MSRKPEILFEADMEPESNGNGRHEAANMALIRHEQQRHGRALADLDAHVRERLEVIEARQVEFSEQTDNLSEKLDQTIALLHRLLAIESGRVS